MWIRGREESMHGRRYLTLAGMVGLIVLTAALPWGSHLAYGNNGPAGATFYANSPQPDWNTGNPNGSGTPIRKFVNALPGLGPNNQNNLGQYIPIAQKDTITYPGSDYYHLSINQFTEQLHSDLAKATKLRGYFDENSVDPVKKPHFLGPAIIAKRDVPVRILMDNKLATSNLAASNLFIPFDVTLMGAGTGPDGSTYYAQNRASVHLHGGVTPWISDGTPWQWFSPAGEPNIYKTGVSFHNVPDMPTPPQGTQTIYYSNQQSARLMFYHEHVVGATRLGVYAGLAAPYLIWDDVEEGLIAAGTIPGASEPDQNYRFGYPLVIIDRTFVPNNIAVQDSRWTDPNWGVAGDFWLPHVYEANQDPNAIDGANPYGRWDYGPWFWPPQPASDIIGPVPANTTIVPEAFCDTPLVNGTAYPYMVVQPRAYRFRVLNACNDRYLNLQTYLADTGGGGSGATAVATVDTAPGSATFGQVIAITLTSGGSGYGTAVNYTGVAPGVYLVGGGGSGAMAQATITNGIVTGVTLTRPGSGYTSAPTVYFGGDAFSADATVRKDGEVKMLRAVWAPGWPVGWPTDDRDGGVPDPALKGPDIIQIGNEGGFLPEVAQIPSQPINYEYNRRNIVVLNVKEKALFMGPAERADFILDFSKYAGQTIILYSDSPAPVPAGDPRQDYYTCDLDQTPNGGAFPTRPGYGPNTRTIMQFRVANTAPAPPFNLAGLQAALPPAFAQDQDPPIVPEPPYNAAYGGTFPPTYVNISDYGLTWTPLNATYTVTYLFQSKTIQELFDHYGRMNATLGVELPFTNILNQTTLPLGYIDPPTEIIHDGETQLWRITHNGVDTHAIHFHLFNVQVINRVGWDGAKTPPDPNEQGWKETVRMNPLEDIVVALKPALPKVPFGVPQSIRYLAPSMAPGATSIQFAPFDALGQPTTTTNLLYNYSFEYVWHCHLLGHEENDMMRPIVVKNRTIPQLYDLLLSKLIVP
jgi:FtsP/CotA-like multicopper oxidase with cupredoxin domain